MSHECQDRTRLHSSKSSITRLSALLNAAGIQSI